MHVQVSLKIEIAASADLTQMEHQIQEAGQQAMRTALNQGHGIINGFPTVLRFLCYRRILIGIEL